MYAVTRCFGTDMTMSRSACLSPYQSDSRSISTIGTSVIPEAPAWRLRPATTLTCEPTGPS